MSDDYERGHGLRLRTARRGACARSGVAPFVPARAPALTRSCARALSPSLGLVHPPRGDAAVPRCVRSLGAETALSSKALLLRRAHPPPPPPQPPRARAPLPPAAAAAPCRLASHFRVSPSVICSSAFKSSGSAQPELLDSHADRSTPVTGPRSAKLSLETPRCSWGNKRATAAAPRSAMRRRRALHAACAPGGCRRTSRKAVTLRLISSNISRTDSIPLPPPLPPEHHRSTSKLRPHELDPWRRPRASGALAPDNVQSADLCARRCSSAWPRRTAARTPQRCAARLPRHPVQLGPGQARTPGRRGRGPGAQRTARGCICCHTPCTKTTTC